MWSAIVGFFGSSFSTYAIIALLAALCGSGVLYKCERDERVAVEKDLAIAVGVNKANDEAIAALKDFQRTADNAITAFADSKDDIEKLRKSLTTSMQRLLTTNEEFRKWYSSTLPPDAIRLYNEAKRVGPASSNGQ